MFEFLMNNLIIVIPCILLVLFFIYKGKLQKGFNKPIYEEKKSFIPSKTFIGSKSGYVFKTDREGLGYYIDSKCV
jgi:hypothetical protein